MRKKRVIIAAGGTGGHIYPAMSLGKELLEKGLEVHFAGGGLKNNQYFDRNIFPYTEITSGFLSTKNPLKLLRGMLQVAWGITQSRKLLKSFAPDMVIGFGSYHTFPILLAAKYSSVPIILHEQNAIPGRVNRIFAPSALFTAISIPDAEKKIPGKCNVVEMPLKIKSRFTKDVARKHFNLNPDVKTLLIFGGSQGAEGINRALLHMVPNIKEMQVIHFTGDPTTSTQARKLYLENSIPACVKEFENRMDLAWSAADLAITRSGASTIAEAIQYEVPLIMIPFPRAMDNHQDKNADFMINTVGGGFKINEQKAHGPQFFQLLHEIPIEKMTRSILEYKKNYGATGLSSLILDALGEKKC